MSGKWQPFFLGLNVLNLLLYKKQTNTIAGSSWLFVWASMIDYLSGCHTDEILLSALCQEIAIVVCGLAITLPIWCSLCTVSYLIFLRVYHDLYLSFLFDGIIVCQCIISALMISVDFVHTDMFCLIFSCIQGSPFPTAQWPRASKTTSQTSGFEQIFPLYFISADWIISKFLKSGKWWFWEKASPGISLELLLKSLPAMSLPHHLRNWLLHSPLVAVGLSVGSGRRHGLGLADITLLLLADLNIGWDCLSCNGLQAHVTLFWRSLTIPLHSTKWQAFACHLGLCKGTVKQSIQGREAL